MNRYAAKPNATSFPGRGVGPDDQPFFTALRRKTGYTGSRYASSGTPVYVQTPYGRQCTGYVVSEDGNRILRKTKVRRAAHYCKKHYGFGLELDALSQAHRLGVQVVRLVFDDSDLVLEAPMTAFRDHGVRDSLGGFRQQVFLHERYWRNLTDPQGVLFDEVIP